MKFVGLCGSNTIFLQEVTDDFHEFFNGYYTWKLNNPRATDKRKKQCLKKVNFNIIYSKIK